MKRVFQQSKKYGRTYFSLFTQHRDQRRDLITTECDQCVDVDYCSEINERDKGSIKIKYTTRIVHEHCII